MKTGVLLSAHGTIDKLEDIPAFLARIRRGRPVPPALVEETRRRYELIGGSPLLSTTREVARLLSEQLGLPVFVGMRLWDPSLEGAITEARDAGVERLLSLPLSPQGVHVYHQSVHEAAARVPGAPTIVEAPPWGETPGLIEAFVEVIRETLGRFERPSEVPLVLSAHSLPTRVIQMGDPYETLFQAMTGAIGAKLGEQRWRIAYQSQGYDGGEWLGPDLKATFKALAAEGHKQAALAAVGFLSDHIETLYDLDVEAPKLAAEAGLERFERAPSLNARPAYIKALAAVARGSLG